MAPRAAAPPAPRAARPLLALLLAAAAGAAAAAAVPGMLTPAQLAEWQAYGAGLSGLSVGPQRVASALQGVLDYAYSTPLSAIQSSNVYYGSNARVRRVVADLLAGKRVKIVAVGGPATAGDGAAAPGRSDYFTRYVAYLARAFPGAAVKAVRAPAGLAPSGVVAACLDKFVASDADLVILEMAANDGTTMDSAIVGAWQPRAYEVLVRRILGGSNQPAVVLLQTMPNGMANGTRPFFMTPEAPHYNAVSGYYNLPYLSMRNAIWPGGDHTPDGLMDSASVSPMDGSTPLDPGHAALADALVFMTQRTAQDLQLLPYGQWDTSSAAADVPSQPMYDTVDSDPEWVLRNATCGWVTNATVSRTGGCPADMSQMCGLDYSSWDAIRAGYAKNITETWGEPSHKTAALIGGVVAGVVAALCIIGGLVAWAVIRQRRRAAAEEAAWAAKVGGGAAPGALPITASSTNI